MRVNAASRTRASLHPRYRKLSHPESATRNGFTDRFSANDNDDGFAYLVIGVKKKLK